MRSGLKLESKTLGAGVSSNGAGGNPILCRMTFNMLATTLKLLPR
jgi:hypothetical protein